MAIKISDECINCGACEECCPTGAISEDAARSMRVISPDLCTECVGFYERTMCQVECPVECCQPDPDRVETVEQLLAKARALFPDRAFEQGPARSSKIPPPR